MITVIGPNPAIDITLEVPHFAPGEVWRARTALHVGGGKPLNVSRTLRRLGEPVTLVTPLGELYGGADVVRDTCDELGIELRALRVEGAVRTCVVVVDSEQGISTLINERGAPLSSLEAAAYEQLVRDNLPHQGLVIASGSISPGLPIDLYARLATWTHERGTRLIVDTSEDALRRTLEEKPWAIKVNSEELKAVTGAGNVREGAADLLRNGVEHVIITMGEEGALYVGSQGALRVSAAPVRAVNPTGAGDAFLAGLAWCLQAGGSWGEALLRAAATSGLVAAQLSPDIGPHPDLEEILPRIHICPV